MRRAAPVVLAALAGLVAGGLSMVALQAPAADRPDDAVAGDPPAATTPPPMSADDWKPDDEVSVPAAGLVLVWAAGGVPDGLAGEVERLPGVGDVTTVAGDLVGLTATHTADGTPVDEVDEGWSIPMDVLAIDPAEYARVLPKADQEAVAGLPDRHVLLGETSAELRGLQRGDHLTFAGGHELTVHAVVADTLVGAAEVVVGPSDATTLGVDIDRFLLVRHTGERAAVEHAVRRVADVEVRVRAPGETPYLRHGDAVLPQVHVKREFGEFASRLRGDGETIDQDPAWVADHVETAEVPVLGTVRCHRSITKQLTGAFTELAERGLGHLVDPDQYAGCHAPRLTSHGSVSRHAWGIAIDLNADDNPEGGPAAQDPRLVDTFERWGFTWGGFWLVPDPMHLEYVGPPQVTAPKVDVDAD